ncbi:MAG: ATP-binding cassette domain-containing protein [Propionibacteriaceae bacterium]|jgi:ATPase subunit of ABC transporter with duplicated ATPase domains|nr:ATP-binding cassette domain-containing protein [Propionibacteriaceae bacterium]
MQPSITVNNVFFSWPDGSEIWRDLNVNFNQGRTGLVGDNGSGKSTLLRLISGQLPPAQGEVVASGQMAYVPQVIEADPAATVADLMGVRQALDAIMRLEAGDYQSELIDIIDDRWDLAGEVEQALARLRRVGGSLIDVDLDRPVGSLSGGEAMLLAITGAHLRAADITLLDEPTNNLDQPMREYLLNLIDSWPGTLLLVSHDRALLDRMDQIAECFDGRINLFGGNYEHYEAALAMQQAAAIQAVNQATGEVKRAKRDQQAAAERQNRLLSRGKAKAIKEGLGRDVRHGMAQKAEKGAARQGGDTGERVSAALAELDAAEQAVRGDEPIRIDLPDPGVPAGRRLLEISWPGGGYVLQGPIRLSVEGRNGAGKTTVLRRIVGLETVSSLLPDVRIRALIDRIGYLPQSLGFDGVESSALDLVGAAAPTVATGEIRSQLARLHLRGDQALRPVASLSGGERFRVGLARLLLADPPCQLLILDEPTNNLDRRSVRQLVEALANYRGAMIVVSHDREFTDQLGMTDRLTIDGGQLIVSAYD